jgi:hypothetical protein
VAYYFPQDTETNTAWPSGWYPAYHVGKLGGQKESFENMTHLSWLDQGHRFHQHESFWVFNLETEMDQNVLKELNIVEVESKKGIFYPIRHKLC